jgi:hypothetical protein
MTEKSFSIECCIGGISIISISIKNKAASFIIIFPILLLFFAEFIVKFDEVLSSGLKLLTLTLFTVNIFLANKYNFKILALFWLFLVVLLVNTINSFNLNAGLEELLRFIFAPIFLMYGYTFRKKIDLFIILIISMAFLSDLFQIVVYIDYMTGLGLMDAQTKDGGYVINVGLFGIANAILNLSAFILVLKFSNSKYRKFLLIYFFIFTFLTFSYKTIPFLFFSIFAFIKRRFFLKISLIVLFFSISLVGYEYILDIYEVFLKKIDYYILIGNSARFESYRVMVESLSNFNLIGEGLGSFGGPSSIAYDSPLYDKYNFNWFDSRGIMTTDTYYPHLFVELSWAGGFLFLFMLYYPIIKTRNRSARKVNLFLLAALLFDALFSFALNNLLMLSCTVLIMYGIDYKYEKLKDEKNIIN